MFIMFLVDQIQELNCSLFKAARNRCHSKTTLWFKLRSLFANYFIDSWDDIWLSIIYGHQAAKLAPNSS